LLRGEVHRFWIRYAVKGCVLCDNEFGNYYCKQKKKNLFHVLNLFGLKIFIKVCSKYSSLHVSTNSMFRQAPCFDKLHVSTSSMFRQAHVSTSSMFRQVPGFDKLHVST